MNKKILKLFVAVAFGLSLFSAAQTASAVEFGNSKSDNKQACEELNNLVEKLRALKNEFASNYDKYKSKSLNAFLGVLDKELKDNILPNFPSDVQNIITHNMDDFYTKWSKEVQSKQFDICAPYNDPLSKVCDEKQFKSHINKFFDEIINVISKGEAKGEKSSEINSGNLNSNINTNRINNSENSNSNINTNQNNNSENSNSNINTNRINNSENSNSNINTNRINNSENSNSNINTNRINNSENSNSNINTNRINNSGNLNSNVNDNIFNGMPRVIVINQTTDQNYVRKLLEDFDRELGTLDCNGKIDSSIDKFLAHFSQRFAKYPVVTYLDELSMQNRVGVYSIKDLVSDFIRLFINFLKWQNLDVLGKFNSSQADNLKRIAVISNMAESNILASIRKSSQKLDVKYIFNTQRAYNMFIIDMMKQILKLLQKEYGFKNLNEAQIGYLKKFDIESGSNNVAVVDDVFYCGVFYQRNFASGYLGGAIPRMGFYFSPQRLREALNYKIDLVDFFKSNKLSLKVTDLETGAKYIKGKLNVLDYNRQNNFGKDSLKELFYFALVPDEDCFEPSNNVEGEFEAKIGKKYKVQLYNDGKEVLNSVVTSEKIDGFRDEKVKSKINYGKKLYDICEHGSKDALDCRVYDEKDSEVKNFFYYMPQDYLKSKYYMLQDYSKSKYYMPQDKHRDVDGLQIKEKSKKIRLGIVEPGNTDIKKAYFYGQVPYVFLTKDKGLCLFVPIDKFREGDFNGIKADVMDRGHRLDKKDKFAVLVQVDYADETCDNRFANVRDIGSFFYGEIETELVEKKGSFCFDKKMNIYFSNKLLSVLSDAYKGDVEKIVDFIEIVDEKSGKKCVLKEPDFYDAFGDKTVLKLMVDQNEKSVEKEDGFEFDLNKEYRFKFYREGGKGKEVVLEFVISPEGLKEKNLNISEEQNNVKRIKDRIYASNAFFTIAK